MTGNASSWSGEWVDKETCAQFQLDLSSLVDSELDDAAAVRAIAHVERCGACGAFFDEIHRQKQAHRDVSDPEALVERYSFLIGGDHSGELESIELITKLSGIFYQLGKAYVLTALDPGYRTRVIFEEAVPVGPAKNRGRGFVDGVLEKGRSELRGTDLRAARGILNGQLEKITSPLEKGRRLLREALAIDPGHEEARFYVAYVHKHEGKTLRAAKEFRQLFNTAIDDANRALAVLQLGQLFAAEGEFKKAVACCRWVIMSGLADADERFFYVRFNIGLYYADMHDQGRSLQAFRELLDRHPGRAPDVAQAFRNKPRTRAVIDSQPGFTMALMRTCPELFRVPEGPSDAAAASEEKA